jgi:hypothetical protein
MRCSEVAVQTQAEALALRRHAEDLRQTWQARALLHARGKMGAVVLSVLAHNYDDALPVLLRLVFPGFTSIAAPFLCTAAQIVKSGRVVADMVTKDGRIIKQYEVFKSELHLRDAFRRLADEMKLADADRIEMFKAAQRWVVADQRLDPTFDPKDPDAKRLTH